jgi:colanic acid biosynthesis glycosyl transferase WcaI
MRSKRFHLLKIIMRVSIISCVFPPEPVTSAITSASLAEDLAGEGHSVTVIAPQPSRPSRAYFSQEKIFSEVSLKGAVRIKRVGAVCRGSQKSMGRLLENITFGITSTLAAIRSQPDIIYLNTWPVFAVFLTVVLSRVFTRAKIILSLQDMYPEAAISIGVIKDNGFASWLMRQLDKWNGRNVAKIVVISQRMAMVYGETRPGIKEKIVVIPNWMDESRFIRDVDREKIRSTYGVPNGATIIVYAGNIGEVAAVESVIDAARISQQHDDKLFFIVAGGGSRQISCVQRAEGLNNIRFICPCGDQQLLECLNIADAAVLPTKKGGALSSVPSKLLSYMFSGKPVIAAVDAESDTAQILSESQSGQIVSPEDSVSIHQSCKYFQEHVFERKQFGANSKEYATQYFGRTVNTSKVINLIRSCIDDDIRST